MKYFTGPLRLTGRFALWSTVWLTASLATSQAFATVKVLACEPEWASLVQAVGGDKVKVASATTAFQDPHHIEARPSLIAKTRNADLIVCTGSELEIGWLPLLLRQSGNSSIQPGKPGHLMASELVARLEVPTTKLDRSQGDVHASGNPHVHLDPNRLLTIANELAERLVVVDPDNSQYYRANLVSFTDRWQAAIKAWQVKAAPLKGKRVIIQHKNLSYLFEWLGIEVFADLEPKPGIPPTSRHLATTLSSIKQDRPDFIIMSAYQNTKGARWLNKRTELPVVVIPYTVGGNQQATDLFSLFDNTIDMLVKAAADNG